MADLQKRVAHFVNHHLGGSVSLVVGVSGGADSLALLHVLYSLLGRDRVMVAHLDHDLRANSGDDAQFVEQTAVSLQIPFHLKKVDVAHWATLHRLSVEEAGRLLRYQFFAQVARDVGTNVVAVGHHADDQAETVLMHLLRGTGLSGLRGMQMSRPLPDAEEILLIRPFLQTSRREIEDYCAEHALQPVTDPTNESATYFRNRIRHQLLPLLAAYNPRIKTRLQTLAEIVSADYALLDTILQETFEMVLLSEQPADWLRLDKMKWLALPVSIKRGVLRMGVQRLRPAQRNIGFQTIEQTRKMIEQGQVGSQATLPGELHLLNGYATLTIAHDLDDVTIDLPLVLVDSQLLPIPGSIMLQNGWQLSASRLDAYDYSQIKTNSDDWQAFVAVNADVLTVRGRRPGERYQPLGMNGHSVKLKDMMINRKLQARLRDKWPLVTQSEHLIWFVGHQIDDRVRVSPHMAPIVKLTCRKLPEKAI